MKSDQVAQEILQGLRSHSLSRTLFHCTTVLMVKVSVHIQF